MPLQGSVWKNWERVFVVVIVVITILLQEVKKVQFEPRPIEERELLTRERDVISKSGLA